jgi:hypothetical protein
MESERVAELLGLSRMGPMILSSQCAACPPGSLACAGICAAPSLQVALRNPPSFILFRATRVLRFPCAIHELAANFYGQREYL